MFSITRWCLWSHFVERAHLANWQGWLRDPNSMTRRIKRRYRHLEVQVLSHRLGLPTMAECQALDLRSRKMASIREIFMIGDNKILLFARVIMPLTSLVGPWRRLRVLGETPIGKILFRHRFVKRDVLQFARLKAGDFEYQRCTKWLDETQPYFWARRSIFHLSDKPILITEIFLPAFTRDLS